MASRTITVGGGDLFRIAAKEMGDPLYAAAIAAANGLSDPVLPPAIVTLTIPSTPAVGNGGGIFGAVTKTTAG